MNAHCDVCRSPLDSSFVSRCAACEIKAMAARTRERLVEEPPWEALPERWRRLGDGWHDFSDEMRDQLRAFLVQMYEERSDETLARATNGRKISRVLATPDIPLDLFDDPVAEEWADATLLLPRKGPRAERGPLGEATSSTG